MRKYLALLILVFTMLRFNATATDFYWVGGNGNWSDFQHHWATTSGGTFFQTTVPSAFDNVIFDANSFPGALDTAVIIGNTIAYSNDLTFTTGSKKALIIFNVNSALHIYGSMSLAPGMKMINPDLDYEGNYQYSNVAVYFKASTTGKQITTNGAAFTMATSCSFDGVGGSWKIMDSLTQFSEVNLLNGELDLNGKIFHCWQFNCNTTQTRSFKFQNAKILVYIMNVDTQGLTYTYQGSYIKAYRIVGSSSSPRFNLDTLGVHPQAPFLTGMHNNINVNYLIGKNSPFELSDVTINKVVMDGGGISIHGPVSWTQGTMNALMYIGMNDNYTLTIGQTTFTGNDCGHRLSIARGTIVQTSGTFSVTYANIGSLTATGGATFTATQSQDLGGNTGIVITTSIPKTLYWIENGDDEFFKTWNDPTHWSFTSGGVSSGCIPTLIDDVIFDANSFSGTTKIRDGSCSARNIDASGVDELVTMDFGLTLTGSLLLSPKLDISKVSIGFTASDNDNTVDFNGAIAFTSFYSTSKVSFDGAGTWNLLDTLCVQAVVVHSGTFITNGYKIRCGSVAQSGGTFNCNASHIQIVSNWADYGGAFSVTGGTMLNNHTTLEYFQGGALSTTVPLHLIHVTEVGMVKMSVTGPWTLDYLSTEGDMDIRNTVAIDTLLVMKGRDISIQSGVNPISLDTVGIKPLVGTGCNVLTYFHSLDNSSTSTISKASGEMILSEIMLKGIAATGGAQFIANSSLDMGNNTGWVINTFGSKTFYWIGNGGDWEDPAHWSVTSGGTPAGCIPSINDIVYFDENSFSLQNQSISKSDNTLSISGIYFTSVPQGTSYNVRDNTVYGNVQFHPNMKFAGTNYTILGSGKLHFKSAGHSFSALTFTPDDTLFIDDDLNADRIIIGTGTVSINGRQIISNEFDIGSVNAQTLAVDMQNSKVTASVFNINTTGLTIKMDGSQVKILNNIPFQTALAISADLNNPTPPIKFDKVEVVNAVYGITSMTSIQLDNTEIQTLILDTLNGSMDVFLMNAHIHTLINRTATAIHDYSGGMAFIDFAQLEEKTIISDGDSHIGYCKILPGKELDISSGNTLYITETFDAVGVSSAPIAISSTVNGQSANISVSSGTVCCSYLNLSNISAMGGASFIAGPSSNDLYNNSGWDFVSPCTPISISTNLPLCTGEDLQFNLTHPAYITGFAWTGPDQFLSNDENPLISPFTSDHEGLYTVNAGGEIRKIYALNEAKPDTVIFYANGTLYPRSQAIAIEMGYKVLWTLDGQVLTAPDPNATYIYVSAEGDYQAKFITPAGCAYYSNIFIYHILETPTSLTATLSPLSTIWLNWTDNSTEELGFEIFRSNTYGGTYVSIATVGSNVITYEDASVSGGSYYYYVRAIKNTQYSGNSNIATASVVTSVRGKSNKDEIILSPVPVSDQLYVKTINEPMSLVSISDVYGRTIKEMQINFALEIEMNVESLHDGVYMLSVQTVEGRSTQTLFIKKSGN